MRRSYSVQRGRLLGVSLAGLIISMLAFGFLGSVVTFSQSASAAQSIPYKINFQGRLTDNSGNILPNGTYNVKFKIYDAATAGTLLYSEDRVAGTPDNRITVTNGLFSIQLGDVSALSPSIFNSSSPRFLEVELPTPATATSTTPSFTEGPMTPRQPLGAAAYAFNADTVDGIDGSSLVQLSPGSQQTGSINVSGNIQTGGQLQGATATLSGASSLTVGTSSASNGSIIFKNATNVNTITVVSSAATSSYQLTLPAALGVSGDCLKDSNGTGVLAFGSCGGSSATLQAGYTASTGGTTPEIKLDSTRGSLDIQDADTTLGATAALLTVRASNSGGLGTELFKIQGNGNVGLRTASPTATLHLTGANGASGGGNAPEAFRATGGLGGNSDSGILAGAGGSLVLQGGKGGDHTDLANGGGAGGNGGNVTINGGNGGEDIFDGSFGATGNVVLQEGNGYVGIGLSNPTSKLQVTNGDVLFNWTSSTALLIQNSAKTVSLFTADTFNNRIVVGASGNTLTLSPATGIEYAGTARKARKVSINAEYPGATFTGTGGANNGTLTSDFCSATGRLNVNATVCPAAGDEHNYYSWTTSQATAQTYDIYVRHQIPSDFSAFASNAALSMSGFVTTLTTDKVELALFQSDGAQCGTTTNVATASGAWTSTAYSATLTSCAIAAGDTVTIRVKLTAGAAGDFARAGRIQYEYLSKF